MHLGDALPVPQWRTAFVKAPLTQRARAQVALPELDGAMEPIVFAGRDPTTGKAHTLPDRVESLVTRAIKWAALRKKKVAEKKLAITVFSFPPDKGNVGTAAYLNVFGSIFKVLKDMKRQGYDVRSPSLCVRASYRRTARLHVITLLHTLPPWLHAACAHAQCCVVPVRTRRVGCKQRTLCVLRERRVCVRRWARSPATRRSSSRPSSTTARRASTAPTSTWRTA